MQRFDAARRAQLGAVLTLLTLTTPALAQAPDPEDAPDPSPTEVSTPEPPAEEPAPIQEGTSSEPSTTPHDPVRIDRVYVPRGALSRLLRRFPGGVFLDEDAFQGLLRRIAAAEALTPPAPEGEDPAPFPCLIGGLQVRGEVVDGVADLEVSARVEVLHRGWVAVDLPLRSLGVREVRVDGAPARLRTGLHSTQVVLRGPEGEAPSVVREVVWRVGVRVQPGDERGAGSFSLPLPAAAAGTLDVVLPGVVEVEGRRATVWTEALAADATRLLGALGGAAGELRVQYRPQRALIQHQPYTTVDARSAFGVGHGVVTLETRATLQVHRTGIERVLVDLPPGFVLGTLELRVGGAALAGLTPVQRGDRVEVPLSAARRGEIELTLRAGLALGHGEGALEVEVGVPSFPESDRVAHLVGVSRTEGSDVEVHTEQGLERVDLETLGSVEAPHLLQRVYRVVGAPQLGLRVAPLEPEAELSVLAALDVRERELETSVVYQFTAREGRVFTCRAELPAGFSLEDHTLVRPAHAQVQRVHVDGREALVINLQEGLRPGETVEVIVRGRCDVPDGVAGSTLSVPVYRGSPASFTTGFLGVRHDPSFRLARNALQGLSPVPAEELHDLGVEYSDLALGLRIDEDDYAGVLSVRQRETRLSAQVLAQHVLRERVVHSVFGLELNVRGAPLRQLDLWFPVSAGVLAEVTGPGLLSDRELVEERDGRALWRFQFESGLLGQGLVHVEFETTLPEAEGRAVTAELPRLGVAGAFRERGTVAVYSSDAARVSAQPQGLRAIQVTQVPGAERTDAGGRPLFAYTYVDPGYVLGVALERPPVAGVLSAVVELLELESSVGKDGTTRHQATFLTKNLDNQFFALSLPEGAVLWSVVVDGRGVKPAEQGGLTIIPISSAGSKSPEAHTRIEATYTLDAEAWGALGRADMVAPELLVRSDEAVPVLRTRWGVALPEDYRVVEFAGTLTGAEPQSVRPLLASLWSAPGFDHAFWEVLSVLVVLALLLLASERARERLLGWGVGLWRGAGQGKARVGETAQALWADARVRQGVWIGAGVMALIVAVSLFGPSGSGYAPLADSTMAKTGEESKAGWESLAPTAQAERANKARIDSRDSGSGGRPGQASSERDRSGWGDEGQGRSGPTNTPQTPTPVDASRAELERLMRQAQQRDQEFSGADDEVGDFDGNAESPEEDRPFPPQDPESGAAPELPPPPPAADPAPTPEPTEQPRPERPIVILEEEVEVGTEVPKGTTLSAGQDTSPGGVPTFRATRELDTAGRVGLRSLVLNLPRVGREVRFEHPGGGATLEVGFVRESALLGTSAVLALLAFVLVLVAPRLASISYVGVLVLGLAGLTAASEVVGGPRLTPALNALALGVLLTVPAQLLMGVSTAWGRRPWEGWGEAVRAARRGASGVAGLGLAWAVLAPGVAQAQEGGTPEARAPEVYVPYGEDGETGRVFVPAEVYRELWRRAHPAEAEAAPPVRAPMAYTVRDVQYDAEDREGGLRLRAVVEVEVLVEGWQRCPLGLAGAGLVESRLAGPQADARVLVSGAGGYTLAARGPGVYRAELELLVPRVGRGYTFATVPAHAATLRARTDRAGQKVLVEGARAEQTQALGEQGAEVVASLGDASRVTLALAPQEVLSTGGASEAEATVHTVVVARRGWLEVVCEARFEISGAGREGFWFELPRGFEVEDVQVPGLRDWSVEGDRLVVTLRQPSDRLEATSGLLAANHPVLARESSNARELLRAPVRLPVDVLEARGAYYRVRCAGQEGFVRRASVSPTVCVRILGESPLDPSLERFEAPLVGVQGARHTTGVLGLATAGGVSVRVADGSMLVERTQLAGVAAGLGVEVERAFGYAVGEGEVPAAIGLTRVEEAPRLNAEVRVRAEITADRYVVEAQIRYDVLRGRIYSLEVAAPSDLPLGDHGGVEVREVRVVEDEGGRRVYRLGLVNALEDGTLTLRFVRRVAPGSTTLPFPDVRPLGVAQEETVLALAHASGLRLRLSEDPGRYTPRDVRGITRRGWRAPSRGSEWWVAYQRSGARGPGLEAVRVEVARPAPVVTGSWVLHGYVERDVIRYELRALYEIERAGASQFTVWLPGEAAGRAEVVAKNLREVVVGEVEGARAPLRVELQSPAERFYEFALVWEEVLEVGGPFGLPSIELTGLDHRVRGTVLLEKSAEVVDVLELVGVEGPVEPGRAADAPALPPGRGANDFTLVYRVSLKGGEAWSVRCRLRQPVNVEEPPPARIHWTHVTSVFTEEGEVRHRVRYRIGNLRLQFLPLELPEGADVWSVFVEGEPKRLHRDGSLALVPLPKRTGADRAFEVELIYATPSEGGLGEGEPFRPGPPVVKASGVPVGRTYWTLYLPERYSYGEFEGTLRPISTHEVPLGALEELLEERRALNEQAQQQRGTVRQLAEQNLQALDREIQRELTVLEGNLERTAEDQRSKLEELRRGNTLLNEAIRARRQRQRGEDRDQLRGRQVEIEGNAFDRLESGWISNRAQFSGANATDWGEIESEEEPRSRGRLRDNRRGGLALGNARPERGQGRETGGEASDKTLGEHGERARARLGAGSSAGLMSIRVAFETPGRAFHFEMEENAESPEVTIRPYRRDAAAYGTQFAQAGVFLLLLLAVVRLGLLGRLEIGPARQLAGWIVVAWLAWGVFSGLPGTLIALAASLWAIRRGPFAPAGGAPSL